MTDHERQAAEFLAVRFSPDTDGTGELHVTAAANGFTGHSSAWFDSTELARFAASLATYPLPADAPLTLAGGFWSQQHRGELEQEHIRLDVRPIRSTGQIGVAVHLATPVWPDTRPQAQHEVRLELLTTYERMRRFSQEMTRIVSSEQPEARLEAELLL